MQDVSTQALQDPAPFNALPRNGITPASDRAAEVHRRVIEMTKTLFSGEPRIDVVRDPEYGDWAYSVSVQASGDVQQLLALSDSWHDGLLGAAAELARNYCLSLLPRDEPH